MRIGVVTTSYPRFDGDPAGSFVAAHVAATRALGHDVDVIAAGDGPGRIASPLFYGAGAPEELERGGRWLHAASFAARLALAVTRRARRWDAIIAHWLAPSALAALLVTRGRAPLLAIAHGGDVHALRRARLLAPALHALHARRARLAFVSDELLALARAAAPRAVAGAIVQPMGLDLARFRTERAPTRTLLVVSRLVPIKAIDVAIRAARELDLALTIAGDGPERAALEQLAAATGARVRFVGTIDPATRDALLATCAAVLVPSRVLANGRSEGTPMIALEALAAGAPVIASAVGGLPALAPAVHLVPPDDPARLAAAIRSTLASPPSADRQRAAVEALDWFTVSRRLLAQLA